MTDPADRRRAAARKAEQRARDKAAGLATVTVVVPAERVREIQRVALGMRQGWRYHEDPWLAPDTGETHQERNARVMADWPVMPPPPAGAD